MEFERKREEGIAEALRKKDFVKPYHSYAWGSLHDIVKSKAPRLLEDPFYGKALSKITRYSHVREARTWEPKGKGRETLYRSLCEHLFALYPMPAFLWSAFHEEDSDILGVLVEHLGKGGSMVKAISSGLLPVPFTRQMCHDFMITPSDIPFMKAIRRAEIRALKGDNRLYRIWSEIPVAQRLQTSIDEAFWLMVLAWLVRNPMLAPEEIGPLVDYIRFKRREDPAFDMKGRSALALIRGMKDWHGDLARQKVFRSANFRPSGFRPMDIPRSDNGSQVIWRIHEILTAKELAEEGRRMGHCVYSYAQWIEKGDISIWSLRCTNEYDPSINANAALTIEVRNDSRSIVQARGRFNRSASGKETAILSEWAGKNNLTLSVGRW